MDIQTRKITFIQEFLGIQDEKIIALFESLLRKEKEKALENKIKQMSLEELNGITSISCGALYLKSIFQI